MWLETCAFKHLNSDWCSRHEPFLLPDVCWRRNVTHCKFYSLYNTLLGSVSAADFVFEPLWQLARDRLTAHPLHKRQRKRERGDWTERPSQFCSSPLPLHLSVLWDRVCDSNWNVYANVCLCYMFMHVWTEILLSFLFGSVFGGHSFTAFLHLHVIPNLYNFFCGTQMKTCYFFVCLNFMQWKSVGSSVVLDPFYFHCMDKKTEN